MINGTPGTVLFSQEKRRAQNSLVKNSVNGPPAKVVFSKERTKLKLPCQK